jgi:hypothetical protein
MEELNYRDCQTEQKQDPLQSACKTLILHIKCNQNKTWDTMNHPTSKHRALA